MKKKKIAIKYYLSSYFVTSALALVQIALYIFLLSNLTSVATAGSAAQNIIRAMSYVSYALYIASIIVVFHIVSRQVTIAYKLAWVIPILIFPFAGGFMYLIARSRSLQRRYKVRRAAAKAAVSAAVAAAKPANSTVLAENDNLSESRSCFSSPDTAKINAFLASCGFERGLGLTCEYMGSGESMHESMLEYMKKAQSYILLEFFIIQEGLMWGKILPILCERAAAGVDVRVIYDGMGSVKTLPRNYHKKLEEYNIKARVFRPYTPLLSTYQNNRDHRKIIVIDGCAGYIGGINLADEYINAHERFGHWKDNGLLLKGRGCEKLTAAFLEQWLALDKAHEDINKFFITETAAPKQQDENNIILYFSDPYDDTNVAQGVYASIVECSKKYLYIMTPYLIPGEDINSSLIRAAKSGVDVRIITPHKPDKTYVHLVSRSYYKALVEAGARVFEYTPGFCHCKSFVSDDEVSVVGSINLDYRALYLQYENAALLFGPENAASVKEDFFQTQAMCMEITADNLPKNGIFKRLLLAVLRVFEPVL